MDYFKDKQQQLLDKEHTADSMLTFEASANDVILCRISTVLSKLSPFEIPSCTKSASLGNAVLIA